MSKRSFRRRTFLGSALAGLVGLSGCSETGPDRTSHRPTTRTTTAQKGTPTGTETGTGTGTETETTESGTETESETDTPASAVPEHDHSGPGTGGSTIITEQLIHRARDTENVQASAHRPLLSTEPRDTYVDPTFGDDGNPGTEDRPVKTIQEALDRVPIVVQHRHHIYLADGTYPESPKSAAGHFVGSYPHNPHPMRIQGNPGNPSRVVIDGTPGLSVRSNEMDNPVLTDLTITGSIQNYDSHFQVANIRFTGTGDRVLGGSAMKTHDPSVTRLQNCTFAENYDAAVEVSLGGTVMLDGCRGTLGEYAITLDQGATAIAIGGNDLSGRKGFVRAERGARFIDQRGRARSGVIE